MYPPYDLPPSFIHFFCQGYLVLRCLQYTGGEWGSGRLLEHHQNLLECFSFFKSCRVHGDRTSISLLLLLWLNQSILNIILSILYILIILHIILTLILYHALGFKFWVLPVAKNLWDPLLKGVQGVSIWIISVWGRVNFQHW
jgi:hypothetical protein